MQQAPIQSREQEKQHILEDEIFMLRDSGEIPEVAYHGCIHYLTADPEGPGLRLTETDHRHLQAAVAERYCTIILRDLDPENRDKRLYRGLARCVANWRRLRKFCLAHGHDLEPARARIGLALTAFLEQESCDVASGRRPSCINCSAGEVQELIDELDLECGSLPPEWSALCPPSS